MAVRSKKIFFLHFDPIVKVWVLTSGVEDISLQQFFLSSLSLFDFIFSGIVWIDKLRDCYERICFSYNRSYGNWKKLLFQLS